MVKDTKNQVYFCNSYQKIPASRRMILLQEEISCHRKKIPVTRWKSLSQEKNSCHRTKLLSKEDISFHRKKFPVPGRNFLSVYPALLLMCLCIIVQLGLKLNNKMGFKHHPTPTKNFWKGSRQGRMLRFGTLTLPTNKISTKVLV